MNIFQYQFNNRLLIIDKSTNPISHARLTYKLENANLNNAIFDLEKMIPTDNYFINIFRHHSGLKSLTNILIPKPRKASVELLSHLNSVRDCFYTTVKLIDRFNNALSTSLILSYFKDIRSLMAISKKGKDDKFISSPLPIISNDAVRLKIINILESIYSAPLFQDDENNGKNEVDLSVFVHCNIPIFLYTPEGDNPNAIHDKLLSNHLKAALKDDNYSITPEVRKVISNLQKDINELNDEIIVPFKSPQVADIEYMMTY